MSFPFQAVRGRVVIWNSTNHCYAAAIIRSIFLFQNPVSGELTFVLVDYRCPWGSGHQSKFFVFLHPVEILEFVPSRGEFLLPSLIDVRFSVKEPLRDDVSNTWIKGRGFWVEECLKISHGSDWDEFVGRANRVQMHFLMRIYTRAVELNDDVPYIVPSRGHWQVEWFPGGIYSERPSFRR